MYLHKYHTNKIFFIILQDADVWALDFVAIMEKLMRTGYDSLSDL